MQPLHAMTQSELLAIIEARIRDASNARWTDSEIYQAINQGIRKWGDKVVIPFVYSLSSSSSDREYQLPYYVHGIIDPQFKATNSDIWQDFPGACTIVDDGTGSRLLQLAFYPKNSSARIVYWARNSPVFVPSGLTLPTVSGTLQANETSLTISSVQAGIADTGYVKIDQEWIGYAGRVAGATTTTLNNLIRGCFGTTAASHSSSIINMGIVVHRDDLYEQLIAQTLANLHSLYLSDASTTEKEKHQWAMRYFQQQADEFWRTYKHPRPTRFRLTRQGVGQVHHGYSFPVGARYREFDLWP